MGHEIEIERVFRAGHALRLYDGGMEPAHEHDWRVVVRVRADRLDAIEVVMDFHALERIVNQALEPLRGRFLNDLDLFAGINPSAERVAEHLYRAIGRRLPAGVALGKVTVTEAPGCRASYWE
jgi:6-pyruvoyl-tetrahydropterin synthase